MRALPLSVVVVLASCDPIGVWDDIQDGPDDDDDGAQGEGEGEGDASEGEGEGDGPLAPCCDSLEEVTLPDEYELVSFALNRAGVPHGVFHWKYTGVGQRPLAVGVASGGSFALDTIEFDTTSAGFIGFDAEDRPVVTRSSSSGVSVLRRVSTSNWESLSLFSAPGPPYVSSAFVPTPTDAGIAIGVLLVTVEDPGEGSCPGGISSCFTYAIGVGTEAGNRFVAFDIGSDAYPVAVGGSPGSFVVAWATYNGPSDVIVARETATGDFNTSTVATDLGSAHVAVAPDGTVFVVGVENVNEANPRLVLLEDGASFSRTVLTEDPRFRPITYARPLAIGGDGAAVVLYGLAADGGAPAELRLARKRGSEQDDSFVVTLAANAGLQSASVAADSSGRAHVMWSEYVDDVYVTRYLAP